MRAGNSFVLAEQYRDIDPHLWIVLSDPAAFPDQVVLVNLTTHNERKDPACIVERHEHPNLTHRSCVMYAEARTVALTHLRDLQLLHLPEGHLAAVERFLQALAAHKPAAGGSPSKGPAQRDWPHAPLHRLSEQGTYLVTAATHQKGHYFACADRLDPLEAKLLSQAKEAGGKLEAWAVFSNHYHFVGHACPNAACLSDWIAQLHQEMSAHVNQLDQQVGRQVWFNYWETELTFETSYLARLNYVPQNPVKHGLVRVANQYRWCSAPWFERSATPAQVRTLYAFKTDQVNVHDDFEPI